MSLSQKAKWIWDLNDWDINREYEQQYGFEASRQYRRKPGDCK
ncbi:hypothetical protein SBDP1_1520012 [Syntrophobacter sp. SbD1]|nr:hypothetical protein SBDP1_1520012 [Syntrophobacter sp. SbD1]